MPITTRLTTLLGIQSPIVSAPMASAASPAMAAAVTGAGAFGFFGAGRDTSQQLRDGLRSIRKTLDIPSGAPVPAGVGFLGWILDRTEVSDDPRIPAYLEEMPAAIWFAFGTDLGKYITQVRAYDAKREHKTLVFVIVNSVEEALRATNEWKVDVLVVQGRNFNHNLPSILFTDSADVQEMRPEDMGGSYAPPLLSLLQAVLNEISNGPVIIAAGGITTGAQSAALLAMGADGVVIGSRLLCAPESVYSEAIKEEILKAGMNATARSYAFDDVNRTRYWPEGIDGRALANDILVDFDKGLDLDARLKNYDEAKTKGERSRLVVWAGVGIGFVKDKRDSATIIKEIHDEMVHTLQAVTRRISLKL